MTRAMLWVVLVAMMVSLIVQSSALALASPNETPEIDRLEGTATGDNPVPALGTRTNAPTRPDDTAELEDVANPDVGSFDGVVDPTFPPVMTSSTRARDGNGLDGTGVVEADAGLLENDARREIYGEVTRSPGISMSEVAERTGVPLSTVRYHTWVLSTEDALEEAKIRGKRRLFPATMDRERMELNAAMEDDATARMLDTIRSHGPASVSELAEALDRSASTVSYHLQRLQDAGLVERERADGATVTQLDPFVRAELSGAIEADGGTPTSSES